VVHAEAGTDEGSEVMIARTWRGWASAASADAYQHHYATTVAAELRRVAGFRGARLLRRADGDEVQFTSIVYFTGMDAVRAFAGDECERAVVAEDARRVLNRWDKEVIHHEVAVFLT
jgi:hypothetical protein